MNPRPLDLEKQLSLHFHYSCSSIQLVPENFEPTHNRKLLHLVPGFFKLNSKWRLFGNYFSALSKMFRVRGKTLSCVPTSLQFMTKEAVGGFPEMMIPYLVVGCLRASAETFPPSTKLKLCKKFTSLDCNAWIFSPLSIQFPCTEKLKVLKWDETWSSFFKTLHCRKKILFAITETRSHS